MIPRLRRTALWLTAALLVSLGSVASVGAATSQATKKGDPITIMTIGEFEVAAAGSHNPEVSGAVEARAKAINKAGGLKDATGTAHKLVVEVCNTDNDPNKAQQCANDAVDKGVAAVVGAFSTLSSSIYPILEAANIPSIGQTPSEPTPFVNQVSFTTQSGIPGIFFDMPRYLASNGAKKLSLVVPDLPAAAQTVPLVKLAAQAAGAQVVNEVSVPLDAADLAPQVAAATANGADGIMAVVIGDQTGRFIRGLVGGRLQGQARDRERVPDAPAPRRAQGRRRRHVAGAELPAGQRQEGARHSAVQQGHERVRQVAEQERLGRQQLAGDVRLRADGQDGR